MLSEIKDELIPPPGSMPIIFFSCLIVWARIFSTKLKRSESRHPWLVPDFSRKAFRD